MKTGKLTHRRESETLGSDVILFADDVCNAHYGDNVWTLETTLPEISCELIAWAAEYYGVDKAEAEALVNPENIVDTAAAWDDRQFVSDLWQAMEGGEIKESAGYSTQDGAVVIDRESVELTYGKA